MAVPGPKPVSVHDLARELRSRIPDAGQAQVHKWSYYAQAWHLVLTGVPLFEDEIEAYAHGPVVATLWKAERHGWPRPQPTPLPATARLVVDLVLDAYGDWPAWRLKRQTHEEGPWRDLMEDDGPAEPSPVITHEALVRWFESTGEADQVRSKAFAREDADEGHARKVARARASGVRSARGRPVDDHVLAALQRASGDDHITDPRP